MPKEGIVIRRLLRMVRRRPSGGSIAPYTPAPDSVPALLSPGWVSPEVRRYLSQEDIDRINAPPRPDPTAVVGAPRYR